MKTNITVSIIIPVFDQLAYTRVCLDTLYKNTDPAVGFEVIVVDNGSSDGTPGFLAEAGTRFPNFKVVTNSRNLGFARACNTGAKNARGKYLLFLNNDTEPQPHWLPPLLHIAETDPSAAAVGAKLLYPDYTIQHAGAIFVKDLSLARPPEIAHIYWGQTGDFPRANRVCVYQAVTAACMLVKKSLFHQLKGFDETYWNGYEDIDLCLKMGEIGMEIFYQPQSVVIHHESGSGIERYSRQDDNYHYFRKKWHSKIKPDYIRDMHRPYKLSPQSPIAGHAARVLSMKYLPPNYIASQYFYRGEMYQGQAGMVDQAVYYYKKARCYLQKVKEKNIYHDYRLASLNKRLGCWRQAAAGFTAILSQNPGAQLKAGAYFHLGEIEMQRHNFTHARDFFKKTLEINPHHKKATELLAGMVMSNKV